MQGASDAEDMLKRVSWISTVTVLVMVESGKNLVGEERTFADLYIVLCYMGCGICVKDKLKQ